MPTHPPVAAGARQGLYNVYGIQLASAFPFVTPLRRGSGAASVSFRHEHLPEPFLGHDRGKLLYASTNAAADGGAALSFFEHRGSFRIQFGRHLAYDVSADTIRCESAASSTRDSVEIGLLGLVLAYWLETKGTICLHASAVEYRGRAAAFMASNHGGKTSLAAGMLAQGAALLTDDLLALDPSEDAVTAHPAFPEMRMWPQEAEQFLGTSDLPTVASYVEKLRVPTERLGRFQDLPTPLTHVYIPERAERLNAGVKIEPLDSQTAFRAFLSKSVAGRLLAADGRQADRMSALSALTKQVVVRRVVFPAGYERLPEVCGVVMEDMGGT